MITRVMILYPFSHFLIHKKGIKATIPGVPSGDSSFINNDETSIIVFITIRPASSDINTDNYVTSRDCSSITDNKGNTSALSIVTDVGNKEIYLLFILLNIFL